MSGRRSFLLPGCAAAAIVAAAPVAAQTPRLSVSGNVGGGVASNPFLLENNNKATGYAEASISPSLTFPEERGDTVVDAHYRRSQYFGDYGGDEAYGVRARTNQRLSPRLAIGATVVYDSSIAGQRGSVFAADPLAPGAAIPLPVPGEGVPDITLIGLRQRQSTLRASTDFQLVASAADRITGDFSISNADLGSFSGFSYVSYSAQLAYSRALSPYIQVGASGSVQWIDYAADRSSSRIIQPQGTFDVRLNSRWQARGALGLLIVSSTQFGREFRTTGLSGNLSLCDTGQYDNVCLSAYRDANASALGSVTRRLGGSVAYNRKLGPLDDANASLSYGKAQVDTTVLAAPFGTGNETYIDATLGYNHRLTPRMSLTANIGYRSVDRIFFDRREDYRASGSFTANFGGVR